MPLLKKNEKNCRLLTILYFLFIYLTSCQDQTTNKSAAILETKPIPTSQIIDSKTIFEKMGKEIRSIFQDKKGNYWFGTNRAGVFRFDGKMLQQFTKKDGLTDNQILSIQEDEMGDIWLGTGGFGITKYDGILFTKQTKDVIITNGTDSDWKSGNKDLWFCAGGGVFRKSEASWEYLPFFNPSNFSTNFQNKSPFTLSTNGVYCILKDTKGNIWFGTQAEGVCRFDGKSLTWLKEKGLAGPAVLSIFEDTKGNLWFGNNGNGLFQYDGHSLINFTVKMGLSNAAFRVSGKSREGTLARIYSINEDSNGNLWIGTVDSGAWKYDGKTLTNFTTKDGLASNAINTIFRDNKGELWFGTDSNGLFKFNGKTFTEYGIH